MSSGLYEVLGDMNARYREDCLRIVRFLVEYEGHVNVRDIRKYVEPSDGQTASRAWVASRLNILSNCGLVSRETDKFVRVTEKGRMLAQSD